MRTIEKIVTFKPYEDAVAAVELKVKIEDEKFYVFDEGESKWVHVNVSMIVKDNLMGAL